jgi:Tol biopolymer transport system component
LYGTTWYWRAPVRIALIIAIAIGLSGIGRLEPAGAAHNVGVTLASHAPIGDNATPNGSSDGSAASADGKVVAFVSTATNLITGQTDTNGGSDIFVFDKATGKVTLASHTAAGATTTASGGASYYPSVSGDGAFVAFVSMGTNLVTGQSDTNNDADIFLFNRATGAVTLVSHNASGPAVAAKGHSNHPLLDRDGTFTSFMSAAPDLVAGQADSNNHFDVFVFDRRTGTTTLASHAAASATTSGALASQSHSMSANGGFILFTSAATNLVGGQSDTNADSDVFLFERATGTLRLVSHIPGAAATTGDRSSSGLFKPALSADGNTVVFESRATNLVPGQADTNVDIDVFVFDRASGTVTLVSHVPGSGVGTPNDASFSTSTSADGSVIAFRSEATNLVPGQADFAGTSDVFAYARATGTVTMVSHSRAGPATSANAMSTYPMVSANGAFIAFQSYSGGILEGQTDLNDRTDVFVYERATAMAQLVSHTINNQTTTVAGSSHSPSISATGDVVVYQSDASNVIAGQSDSNGAFDVFVHERAAHGTTTAGDFDGNGASDVGVFRPDAGAWMIRGGLTTTFGTRGDLPVALDYDGNSTSDVAVYRPEGNAWFVQGGPTVMWGTTGDVPVPADYNGNGAAEFAVFRPVSGVWFVRDGRTVAFGASGDIPVPDDYDGDGDTEIAVFRPGSGVWFFLDGPPAMQFGTRGDVPVPGDYNGDGRAEAAVFRPASGHWFVHNGPTVQFGTAGDIPVPGDYDGDGDTDMAVFRPGTGTWHFLGGASDNFGIFGDLPLQLPSWIKHFLVAAR